MTNVTLDPTALRRKPCKVKRMSLKALWLREAQLEQAIAEVKPKITLLMAELTWLGEELSETKKALAPLTLGKMRTA